MKSKLVIDTDCGSDDAMAIAMALRDEAWEILFFTVVSGNVILEQAVKNTLLSIEMAGTYEPPVYAGCRDMLLHPLAFAHETHGQDGMGDLGLAPERLKPAAGHGVFKMLEALRGHDRGEIEIVTLGPLTNIAVALRLDPAAMARVRRISIMGSAGLGAGNVSPLAEFNIWQDAEAAKIVLESGLPLFLTGWDACLDDAMLEEADIERLRRSGPLGRFVVDCNRRLLELNLERFGRPCLDMADPAAMAAALFPGC
ncbi:MAG: nucleoside hydrolase, partial [Treponema sp.]|nr:nucleoside hydrolase [Treponema sp.]